MKKILFTALAAFAILGCSSNDDMPCMTCGDSDNNGSRIKYVYCLYNNGGGYYSCAYMDIHECESKSYGNDNTCGGYTPGSSSSLRSSSSSLRSSSSSSRLSSSSLRSSSSSSLRFSSSSVINTNGSCNINDYKKVRIGSQMWMAENYNCKVAGSVCYGEGELEEVGYDDGKDEPIYAPKYSPAEIQANCNKYGRLYDWATAMGINARYNYEEWGGSDVNHRGICPNGWHIPSHEEWTTLTNYVGGASTAGTKLKAREGWESYSGVPSGTDEFGFSALPGGRGISDGYFFNVGSYGVWWSASEYSGDYAYSRYMGYSGEGVSYYYDSKYNNMFSIRCVQN